MSQLDIGVRMLTTTRQRNDVINRRSPPRPARRIEINGSSAQLTLASIAFNHHPVIDLLDCRRQLQRLPAPRRLEVAFGVRPPNSGGGSAMLLGVAGSPTPRIGVGPIAILLNPHLHAPLHLLWIAGVGGVVVALPLRLVLVWVGPAPLGKPPTVVPALALRAALPSSNSRGRTIRASECRHQSPPWLDIPPQRCHRERYTSASRDTSACPFS